MRIDKVFAMSSCNLKSILNGIISTRLSTKEPSLGNLLHQSFLEKLKKVKVLFALLLQPCQAVEDLSF